MLVKIENNSIELVPAVPGCYWLIRLQEDGTSKTIGRVADDDPHGILYIGKSDALRTRFKDMLNQFNMRPTDISATAKSGHPASYEWQVSPQNRKAHPLGSIYFAHERLPKTDTEFRELVYLANYRNRFGEYPPWNQPPGAYKKHLPADNPTGRAPIKYDPSCLFWQPPHLREVSHRLRPVGVFRPFF